MTTPEIHAWLMSVVRQRELLIRDNRSRQNKSLMVTHTSYLRKYLEAYSFRDPVKMKRFMNNNLSRILAILPGPGSSCHESRIRELDKILDHLQNCQTKSISYGKI